MGCKAIGVGIVVGVVLVAVGLFTAMGWVKLAKMLGVSSKVNSLVGDGSGAPHWVVYGELEIVLGRDGL